MKQTQDYLIERDIRPSAQRVALMKYLLDHHTHPTVDDIYAALSPEMPTLSKTTIYNTLKLFAEKGAISIITIDSRNAHFDSNVEPHGHLRCTQCGTICDIPLKEPVMPDGNSQCVITDTQVYFHGLCPDCNHNPNR